MPESVTPPAAIVFPDDPMVVYDESMGRGVDRWAFQILVVVSRAVADEGQDALDGYVRSSGGNSIKATIEGDTTLGGVVHDTRVVRVSEYREYEIGGQKLYGARFAVATYATG